VQLPASSSWKGLGQVQVSPSVVTSFAGQGVQTTPPIAISFVGHATHAVRSGVATVPGPHGWQKPPMRAMGIGHGMQVGPPFVVVPGGQALQVVLLPWAAWPAGHCMHVVPPFVAKPVGQVSQEAIPGCANVPAGHAVQVSPPFVADPGGHALHEVPLLTSPWGQGWQSSPGYAPGGSSLGGTATHPCGHAMHVTPSYETWPGGHGLHEMLSLVTVSAGHRWHKG
jgi:hypothetical protein